MAPEVEEGGGAVVQSDLFSVGVVLYQCLTGRLPRGMVRPPSSYGCPEALDGPIAALLDPDPEHRPASARAAREMLLAAADEAAAQEAAAEEQRRAELEAKRNTAWDEALAEVARRTERERRAAEEARRQQLEAARDAAWAEAITEAHGRAERERLAAEERRRAELEATRNTAWGEALVEAAVRAEQARLAAEEQQPRQAEAAAGPAAEEAEPTAEARTETAPAPTADLRPAKAPRPTPPPLPAASAPRVPSAKLMVPIGIACCIVIAFLVLHRPPRTTPDLGPQTAQGLQPMTTQGAVAQATPEADEAADLKTPDLRGKPYDEARRAVEGSGLVILIKSDKETPQGEDLRRVVRSQFPDPGAAIPRGEIVFVTIGIDAQVPDVTGTGLTDAKGALAARSLVLDMPSYRTTSGAPDRVISQSPAAGTWVAWGSAVGVVVSETAQPVASSPRPSRSSRSSSSSSSSGSGHTGKSSSGGGQTKGSGWVPPPPPPGYYD